MLYYCIILDIVIIKNLRQSRFVRNIGQQLLGLLSSIKLIFCLRSCQRTNCLLRRKNQRNHVNGKLKMIQMATTLVHQHQRVNLPTRNKLLQRFAFELLLKLLYLIGMGKDKLIHINTFTMS